MTMIHNPVAYDNAIQRNIRMNAKKTKVKAWYAAHDDAKRLDEWLNGYGEFDGITSYTPFGDDFISRHNNHPATIGMFAGDFGSFLLSMRDNLSEWGALSPKQTEIVRNALARAEQRVIDNEARVAVRDAADSKSEWVGKIKGRQDFVLTIRHVVEMEGEYGTSYFNIMNDADGNVIVGKGTKIFGVAGQEVKVKATVTKHNNRRGVKQTIINRPVFA
jgi:hypothetical protein